MGPPMSVSLIIRHWDWMEPRFQDLSELPWQRGCLLGRSRALSARLPISRVPHRIRQREEDAGVPWRPRQGLGEEEQEAYPAQAGAEEAEEESSPARLIRPLCPMALPAPQTRRRRKQQPPPPPQHQQKQKL